MGSQQTQTQGARRTSWPYAAGCMLPPGGEWQRIGTIETVHDRQTELLQSAAYLQGLRAQFMMRGNMAGKQAQCSKECGGNGL
jgi:hypothetical protein